MTTQNPTRALAEFVAQLQYDNLPPRVIERVKTMLLDAIASGIAGQSADESTDLAATAAAAFGPGDSTLISGGTSSPAGAVVVNGYLITAVTVCDIHIPTVCHVTPEVVPPALAIAEARDAAGTDLILALAAGLEVTTRVGIGLNYQAFRGRGFHSPGVTGPFGGAAAAGKLLNLDGGGLTNAFGIAASQAAGTWAQLGTPTIKFQQARGALGGLLAAMLASRDFRATPDGLGAEDGGLYSSYSDGGDASRLLADIGEDWELERISLRAWPVAAYLQGLVTAMTALTAETVGPDEVSSLVVRLSPTAYELHGERVPSDRFEARLTARYVAAVVLHDRACWLGQFTAERFADPVLHAWSNETVTIVRDESIEEAGAIVEATMSDGSRRAFVAEVPKGDPHDPLSYADVAAKFSSATASDPRGDRLKEVVQTIGDLERVTSTRSITRQLLA